jgi:hypothetical protein
MRRRKQRSWLARQQPGAHCMCRSSSHGTPHRCFVCEQPYILFVLCSTRAGLARVAAAAATQLCRTHTQLCRTLALGASATARRDQILGVLCLRLLPLPA